MKSHKFIGVVQQGNRYRAQIGIGGGPRTLGIFDTPEEAAHEYDYATFYLEGQFRRKTTYSIKVLIQPVFHVLYLSLCVYR